jgi:hypothetical protein
MNGCSNQTVMVNRSLAEGDWATYVSYVDALLRRRHHVSGLVLLHEMARGPSITPA